MKMTNLTPHALTVAGIVIPASGEVARVLVTRTQRGDVGGIPAFVPSFGDVESLPAAEAGTILIVSALVRTHPSLMGRSDVASPGQLVRDAAGAIVGCDGLDFNTEGAV